VNSAEYNTKEFYASTELKAYFVHGLNTKTVKNTFLIFDNFIKNFTLFFKNYINEHELFTQSEESMSIDERLDRMQLHNLLVNTPYDQELLLASGQISLVDN
jgi:hypothetical protein